MLSQSSVFVTKAMFFETRMPKNKPVFVEGRDFYSLTYRYSGRVAISTEDGTVESGADSITFMPKGVSYTTEVLEDVHMATVHFDFECEVPPRVPAVIDGDVTAVRSLFKTLMKNSAGESARLSEMSVLYEILAELDRMSQSSASGSVPRKIEYSRELMEREYRAPYFSVGYLADEVGVSAAYLRREFGQAYGVSPVEYLKELRIGAAKRLLLTERLSVAQIAAECGYTSASYFIQDFHKATGESPGAYRKRFLDFS